MSGKLIQQVVEAAPGHILKYDTCVLLTYIGCVVMVDIQSPGLP